MDADKTDKKDLEKNKQRSTYDPRERIRNLAGTEPETREDDVFEAKAQAALAGPTQNPAGNG